MVVSFLTLFHVPRKHIDLELETMQIDERFCRISLVRKNHNEWFCKMSGHVIQLKIGIKDHCQSGNSFFLSGNPIQSYELLGDV